MLLADLVRQNHARRSVVELCRQNLQLLTRRIVERNAETGEHCVARNRVEYLRMLRSAAGGGAVMGVNALYAALLEPGVRRLELVALPESQTAGPDCLNVLRVTDLPQVLAIVGEWAEVKVEQERTAVSE